MLVFSCMVAGKNVTRVTSRGGKLYLFTGGNMQNRGKSVACCGVPLLCMRELPFYNSKLLFCKI